MPRYHKIFFLLLLSALCPGAVCAREVDPEYLQVLSSTLTVRPYFSIEGGYLSVYGIGETFSTPQRDGNLSSILNQNRFFVSWKF
ncbi:MAG: hypothetical protein WCS77_05385 [Elusimicrobiaceae bacterium]